MRTEPSRSSLGSRFDVCVRIACSSSVCARFCMRIHRSLLEQFKHALVWGTSVKRQSTQPTREWGAALCVAGASLARVPTHLAVASALLCVVVQTLLRSAEGITISRTKTLCRSVEHETRDCDRRQCKRPAIIERRSRCCPWLLCCQIVKRIG